MSLGNALLPFLPPDQPRKALAITWHEHWQRKYPKRPQLSDSTVESRLSELMSDKVQGVRFFFEDPERCDTTFDAWSIPKNRQPELLHLAKTQLQPGEATCRILVDLSWGPSSQSDASALFASFKERFLSNGAPVPVVVLLSDAQYEAWPRSFDDVPQLRVKKVLDAAHAQQLMDTAASQGALVASPRPQKPFERWLAIDGCPLLKLEPQDGIERFLKDGELDRLPDVVRPLAKVAIPETRRLISDEGPYLRKLMLQLAAGMRVNEPSIFGEPRTVSMAQRLGWAQQLGVVASATVAEWDAALPARIGPAEQRPATEVNHYVSLAHFVRVPATWFRTVDGLVLLNPEPDMRSEVEGLPRVTIHEIAPTRMSALHSYVEHCVAGTRDDLDDDPLLLRAMARFADHPADRETLELARLMMLRHRTRLGRAFATITEVARARSTLRRLLTDVSNEAALRVIPRGKVERYQSGVYLVAGCHAPAGDNEAEEFRFALGPVGAMSARRGERVRQAVSSPGDLRGAETPDLDPDTSTWSRTISAALERSVDGVRADIVNVHPIKIEDMSIAKQIWQEADRHLAFVRMAVLSALETATLCPLPSGSLLLQLHGGVFAEIVLREHAPAAENGPEAALTLYYQRGRARDAEIPTLEPLTYLLPTYYADSAMAIGPNLPHAMRVSGNGYRADVTFVASGLHASVPLPAVGGAAAHLEAVREEASQRDEDDDD